MSDPRTKAYKSKSLKGGWGTSRSCWLYCRGCEERIEFEDAPKRWLPISHGRYEWYHGCGLQRTPITFMSFRKELPDE